MVKNGCKPRQNDVLFSKDGTVGKRIIDRARQVVEAYKPQIPIDPSWETVALDILCNKITDGTHHTPNYTQDGIPFLRVTDLTESSASKKFISQEEHQELIKRCKPELGNVLYSKNGTIGVAKVITWEYEFSIFVSLALLKPKRELLSPKFLELYLNTDLALSQAKGFSKAGVITNLHLVEIKKMQIPLIDLETQQRIVATIEREQALVNANKELIQLFVQKIKDRIAAVWGRADDLLKPTDEAVVTDYQSLVAVEE